MDGSHLFLQNRIEGINISSGKQWSGMTGLKRGQGAGHLSRPAWPFIYLPRPRSLLFVSRKVAARKKKYIRKAPRERHRDGRQTTVLAPSLTLYTWKIFNGGTGRLAGTYTRPTSLPLCARPLQRHSVPSGLRQQYENASRI